jgi:hypothetical protein
VWSSSAATTSAAPPTAELDALRGNQGTQYYEVPSGTDPGPGWTVLIGCRAFGVPVANSTQAGT